MMSVLGCVVCVLVLGAGSALAGPLAPPAGAPASTNKTLQQVEPRVAVGPETTPGSADAIYRITQPGSYYLSGNITGELGKNGILITASGVVLDLNGYTLTGVPGSLDGISSTAAKAVTIRNGTIRDWGGDGVDLEFFGTNDSCTLENLVALGNAGDGLFLVQWAAVRNCIATQNGNRGIVGGGILDRCVAVGNGSVGFRWTQGAVFGCYAYSNASHGFTLGDETIVTNCVARNNDGDGFQAGGRSLLISNLASSDGLDNSAAAFRVSFTDARLVGNHGRGYTVGFLVDGTGNLLAGNTASGNTFNWSCAAGNVCHVINAATNPSSFLGSAGGVSPGTTSAWTNLTY